MKNTLKNSILGLIAWLSDLLKTKNISEAGSTASTGDGSTKTNGGIDWTVIILFIIFGVIMYLIPSPLQSNRVITSPVPIEVPVAGRTDTVRILLPALVGKDSTTTQQEISVPFYAEIVTDKETEDAHIYIRTTAYPRLENDSLSIDMYQEFNIEPKGMEITRVDTFYIMKEVPAPVDVPFIEKPYVVAPLAVAITLGIVYITGQALK